MSACSTFFCDTRQFFPESSALKHLERPSAAIGTGAFARDELRAAAGAVREIGGFSWLRRRDQFVHFQSFLLKKCLHRRQGFFPEPTLGFNRRAFGRRTNR